MRAEVTVTSMLHLDQLGSQRKLGTLAVLVHESLEVCIKVFKNLRQQIFPQRPCFSMCNNLENMVETSSVSGRVSPGIVQACCSQ